MTALSLERVGGAALLLMVAAIAGAWGFQVFGGYVPCALCLEQRLGYYAAIPLCLLALIFVGRSATFAKLCLVGAAVAIAWSAGLGIYHAGAEWAFWAGPADCGGGETVTDAANLLAAIENTRLVSCTEATGRFLGLSFAGWNAVAAGGASLLLLVAATRPHRTMAVRAHGTAEPA